jgi:3-dehydroquinate synthase
MLSLKGVKMNNNILKIKSHKGIYQVIFDENALKKLNASVPENAHFIIDQNIANLYASEMGAILSSRSVLRLEAIEKNKSLNRFSSYVQHLVYHKIQRDHLLIAIGGGIIQDVTCFLAATLLRGIAWHFYPTTLLAQADSCIGSKSSVNSGNTKNILGTFTPPQQVFINTKFLTTLDERDVQSGVGEILKAHAIDGPKSFAQIAADYSVLFSDPNIMIKYIKRALKIKLFYIEEDEFDIGPRNVFNYGHSFGHAIEAATDFGIPHGISVTIGMDMANFVSAQLAVSTFGHFEKMHPTLRDNYRGYNGYEVPLKSFLSAISRDKKNIGNNTLMLILPDLNGNVKKNSHFLNDEFSDICKDYLVKGRMS